METRLLEGELKLVKVNYAHSQRRRVILESKVKDLTAYKDGLQHQVSFACEHIERGLHYKLFALNLDSFKFESAITDLCFTATTCDLNDYRAKAGVFAYTQALEIMEHGFDGAVHSFFMLIGRFVRSDLHASTLEEAAYDFRIHNRCRRSPDLRMPHRHFPQSCAAGGVQEPAGCDDDSKEGGRPLISPRAIGNRSGLDL